MILCLKKRIKCKNCNSQKTQRKGSRNGLKRFYCTECKKWFSINYKKKYPLWIDYIDGLSLREIGRRQSKSYKQIDNLIKKELNSLIDNTYLSNKYINPTEYSGVLCLDGKYIKVKGYEKKIPFIYCIDYYSHDIVCGFLCISENRESFRKIFRLLKTVNYPLEFLIVDDVIDRALLPLKHYYPKALLQLCSTHILRNIRDLLTNLSRKSRTNYEPFLKDLSKYLRTKTALKKKEKSIYWFLKTYSMDLLLEDILLTLFKKRDYVFAFCKLKKKLPHSNNLIEGFNSHLEGRLKTIRGFNSFMSAERFLNAWMVRRRTKTFSGCSKKFSYLNGKTSLEIVLKDDFSIKRTLQEIYENGKKGA